MNGSRPLPSVSVIIPHYNDLAALDRCLQSLVRQDYPAELVEVVVCDNNSPLPHERIDAAVDGRANLVFEPIKGAGPARNRAVAHSTGAQLAFIDADCLAAPDWLTKGLEALIDPSFGADLVGGRVAVFSDAVDPTGADLFEQLFAFDFRTYIEKKGFSGAGNLFCSRETFDTVGPFLADVSEDLEWTRRAVAKGFRLKYCHAAVVSHPTRPDWPALRLKWERMTREAYLTRRDAGAGRSGWLLRQVAVAASPLAHSAKVLRSDFSPRHKLRALYALWRIRWWRAAEAVRLAFEDPSPAISPKGPGDAGSKG